MTLIPNAYVSTFNKVVVVDSTSKSAASFFRRFDKRMIRINIVFIAFLDSLV